MNSLNVITLKKQSISEGCNQSKMHHKGLSLDGSFKSLNSKKWNGDNDLSLIVVSIDSTTFGDSVSSFSNEIIFP